MAEKHPEYVETKVDYSVFAMNKGERSKHTHKSKEAGGPSYKYPIHTFKFSWSTAILIVLVLIFFISTLLVGEVLSNGDWLTEKVTYMNTNYYGVGKLCDSYEAAQDLSAKFQKLGAGGYAIKDKDKYIVIGAVYNNRRDAELVMSKESNKRIFDTIHIFTLQKYDLERVHSNHRVAVKEMLVYMDIVYDGLYKISSDIDLGNIEENKVNEDIVSLQKRFLGIKKVFFKGVGNSTETEIIKLKAELNAVESILEGLMKPMAVRPNKVAEIRYAYTMILNMYRQLMASP